MTPCRVWISSHIGVKPRPLWLPATGPVCGGPGLPQGRQFQKWNAYSLATICWQLTPQTYLVTFHLVSFHLNSSQLFSSQLTESYPLSSHFMLCTTKGPKSKVSAIATWIRLTQVAPHLGAVADGRCLWFLGVLLMAHLRAEWHSNDATVHLFAISWLAQLLQTTLRRGTIRARVNTQVKTLSGASGSMSTKKCTRL